jgi:YD repeat-containing protein
MVINGTADSTRTDFARVGSHIVGTDILYFRTWAEFDISPLKGKKITGLGLAVYNEWTGTKITMLKYTSVQPSVSNQGQILAQHNLALNLYVNFSWTINAGGAWTPAEEFYMPDWNNHKRIYGNQNTVTGDLQAHADDPAKTWFALEFSYNGSDRANLRFPSDVSNPASVLLAVVTESAFSDTKNQGDGGGSCETQPSGGKPINFSTGNEHFTDKDFILTGPGLPLGYVRHYNSRSQKNGYIGYGWTGSFSEHLTAETGRIILTQADGGEVYFDDDGQGRYISESYTSRVIIPDGSGGYILTEPDGKTLLFGSSGNLTLIRDRNGNTQNIFYAGGKPFYIEDNFGRRTEFTYNTDGFLETLTTPAGIFTYSYDAQGNPTGVAKPDMTVKTYCYTDTNDPHNLTEAENENGSVYRFEYDAQDRAVFSEFADTGGISVNYQSGTSRKITDSLGRETVFELQASKGIGKVKSVTGAGCGQCVSPSGGKYTLNDRVQTDQSEDAEGNITKYSYDSRGNILTETDASGTPQERTVTYTRHTDYSFVTSVTRESTANPGNNAVTSFTYDTTGRLRQKTENGYSGTTPLCRTTSFDYNAYGQIAFIDGPRTDVTDTLAFEYYQNDAGQGLNRGMLKKITDGAGNETQFGVSITHGQNRVK